MRLPAFRTRSGARLGAVAVFAVVVGLAVGCGEDGPGLETSNGGTDETHPTGAGDLPATELDRADARFLAGRARMTVLLSGAFLGRHKPCGCTAPQLGGLERLAALIDRLLARANGNVLGLSLGWNLKDSGEAQEAAKAELFREALDTLGFGGLLLGDTDLAEIAMLQPYGGAGVNSPIPPLNVILPESCPAADTNTLNVRLRDVPVRAMTLVSPSRAADLKAGGQVVEVLGITAPFSAMEPSKSHLWIVACRLDSREAYDELASAVRRLGPAVIVDFGGVAGVESFEDLPFGPDMQPVIVSIDEHGKGAGVLDFHVDADGNQTLSFRHIPLVPAFDDEESELKDDIKGLVHEYLDLVREREYLQTFDSMRDGKASYVGSLACAKCHSAVFQDWNQTPHAHAIPTLEAGNYEWDPECVRCHVVGWHRQGDTWWRWESGFADVVKTPLLGGVGCENCHGPGSAHVANPAPGQMSNPSGEDGLDDWRRRCQSCHDVENSHGFQADWMAYFDRVGHAAVPSDRRTVVPTDGDG